MFVYAPMSLRFSIFAHVSGMPIVRFNTIFFLFFFSSRRRHTKSPRDWSSDVCSSDLAATQIAKRTGAEVYGTASPSKHERIRELGVDRALDYTQPGWDRDIPSFDVILDAVGGKSFRRSYELLRPGGRLVAFGASSVLSGERRNLLTALRTVARMPRFKMIKQMSESKAVIGLNMLTLWKDRGSLQPWIGPLQELLTDGTVKPVVAGAFPFEEAGAAHSMLVERRNLGKVVLTP